VLSVHALASSRFSVGSVITLELRTKRLPPNEIRLENFLLVQFES